MGWFETFLRSIAKKAFDVLTKELFTTLWKAVVLPVLVTVVLPWITDFGRLRNSFFNLLGHIHPGADYEPSATEYYLYYSGTFFNVLRVLLLTYWYWKLLTRARKSTISLVRLAVGEFKTIVIQNVDSRVGENLAGQAKALLTNLDSELVKYEKTSVAYRNDQLINLSNMKRTLAEFGEEVNIITFDHAQACSAVLTLREEFLSKNKQSDRITISLVRYAIQEFNKSVVQHPVSREGENFCMQLLRDLDNHLVNYERASLSYCNGQVLSLRNMKGTLAHFREDENVAIFESANACCAVMTSREVFFLRNKRRL